MSAQGPDSERGVTPEVADLESPPSLGGGPARKVAEAGWVMFGQAATAVASILGVAAIARSLAPAEYGRLAVGLTFTIVVQQVALSGLNAALLRFGAVAVAEGGLRRLAIVVRPALGRAAVLTLPLGAGGLALGAWLGSAELVLAVASIAFALVTGAQTTVGTVQSALRNRSVVALHQAAGSLGRYGVAAVVLARFEGDAITVLFVFTAVEVLVLLSQGFHLLRAASGIPWSSQRVGEAQLQMLHYARPFTLIGILMWAQLVWDRYALGYFTDATVLGQYAVLTQIGYNPLFFLGSALTQLVAPIVFARTNGDVLTGAGDVLRLVGRLFNGGLAFTFAATIGALLIGTRAIDVLAGEQYAPISHLLPVVVLSAGLHACGQIAALRVLSGTDARQLVAPKVVSALVYVAGVVLGASFAGALGVVVAGLLHATCYCVWARSLKPITSVRA